MIAWLHDLNPIAIEIIGFPIRWYGLSYAAGFFAGWLMLYAIARRGLALIPPERTADMVVTIAIGAVIGGRLGYVLIYQPSLIWDLSADFPWWGVLRINEGGMASHGGMIGAIIGCLIVSRGWRDKEGNVIGKAPPLHVIDLLAALCPIGLLLGRLANFINGELLGAIVTQPASDKAAPWWAVRYPQELLDPVRNAEVVRTDEQTAALYRLINQHRLGGESDGAASARIVDAVQQGQADVIAQLTPLISARHPSQLYQAFAEGIVVFVVCWFVWRKPRLPGVVGCWFLISYGVGRVITEFYRLPDAHLVQARIGGLSRGQWLSVLMVLIGVVALIILSRRGGKKLGGWMTGPRIEPASEG